jgi:hypothetical protein
MNFVNGSAALISLQRYHLGGIAGLRPNEVAAILERGERVLTKNQQKGGGGVMVTVNSSPTIHALDARGVREVLMEHSSVVAEAVRHEMRQFSPHLR